MEIIQLGRYIRFFECILFFLFNLPVRSQSCTSYGNQGGKCVLFQHCPPLSTILEKARDDPANLRLLQQVTFGCGFEGSIPKACCPISVIDLANHNHDHQIELPSVAQINESNLPQPKIGNAYPSKNQYNESGAVLSLSTHPHFRLLPDLNACSGASIADRIVGGTAAPHGGYPWLVRIGYKVLKAEAVVYGCGGSIINENYILSAAHCVQGIGSDLVPEEIRLAEHNTETNPDCSRHLGCTKVTDLKIDNIIVHPKYEPTSKQNDICLIRVRPKMKFDTQSIQPICLPFIKEYGIQNFPDDMEGKFGVVAGFGKTRWNKATGTLLLQHAELPFVSNSKCRIIYSEFSRLRVNENQICAGGTVGKDSCDGDSGGPLMYTFHDKTSSRSTTFLTGVVSFGPRQCGGPAGIPSVYTRTSSYLKWILDVISA